MMRNSVAFNRQALASIESGSVEGSDRSRAGRACTPAQQHELLARMLRNEENPQTGVERFLMELKRMTIQAFYSSELILLNHANLDLFFSPAGYTSSSSVNGPTFGQITHARDPRLLQICNEASVLRPRRIRPPRAAFHAII